MNVYTTRFNGTEIEKVLVTLEASKPDTKPEPLPAERWCVYHNESANPFNQRMVATKLTHDEARSMERFPAGKVELNGVIGFYSYALMPEYNW